MCNTKAEWVENKVEATIISFLDVLNDRSVFPNWFEDMVDWDSVEKTLSQHFSQQWEEQKTERSISDFEDRNSNF